MEVTGYLSTWKVTEMLSVSFTKLLFVSLY
jgi:hypothetical protein